MKHNSDGDGQLEIVRVRLPDEILTILDDLVARGLYANRSEAIRDFARQYAIAHGGRHG